MVKMAYSWMSDDPEDGESKGASLEDWKSTKLPMPTTAKEIGLDISPRLVIGIDYGTTFTGNTS
jgi:hypothetical protein